MNRLRTEPELAAVALALIGSGVTLSPPERRLLCDFGPLVSDALDPGLLKGLRAAILGGTDPLGSAFTRIRPSQARRAHGAIFTPSIVIESMLAWANEQAVPARIVDPGAGSGRFLLAAAQRFPETRLVGVELDPLVALMLRANVAVRGLTPRTTVVVADYRAIDLPKIEGKTAFIGNPPYVRHHGISIHWKDWFANAAAGYGVTASKLAGLHIHFFVKTLHLAKSGDYGAFITSAEWLDVNYGAALRQLLCGPLGGCALHVLEPKAMPFADTATTGAITCFQVGRRPSAMSVRAVDKVSRLNGLSSGRPVSRDIMARASRWSTIVKPTPQPPAGYIELGELCRVHRGAVTGSNAVWIAGTHAVGLPSDVLTPTVTLARDIMAAGDALRDARRLRMIIDLPSDLDRISAAFRPRIERFLDWAKSKGADKSYIARHRRAWWAVGLRDPAPIVCTYMARRAPVFVRNLCDARHINIAHGLYPRESLSDTAFNALTAWLCANVGVENGRTYAGGLTKFEPRELERVPIPRLENLPA